MRGCLRPAPGLLSRLRDALCCLGTDHSPAASSRCPRGIRTLLPFPTSRVQVLGGTSSSVRSCARPCSKCSETRLRRTWAGERGPFVDGSSSSYSQTHRTLFSPMIRKQKSLKKQKAKESKEKHVAFLLHSGPKASES